MKLKIMINIIVLATIAMNANTVEGYVWNDENGNGKKDNGELFIDNLTVKLFKYLDSSKNMTTKTNNGYYSFTVPDVNTKYRLNIYSENELTTEGFEKRGDAFRTPYLKINELNNFSSVGIVDKKGEDVIPINNVKVGAYGEVGPYLNDIQKVNIDEDKIIYYLENKPNFPVVAFIGGWGPKIEEYNAILKYIASWGYNVVALKETDHFKVNLTANKIKLMLDRVRDDYQADTSKVAIVGHSSGGSAIFYVMRYIKEQGLANSKSAVISIDGWVPYKMHVADMNRFDTSTMIMQFGGNNGVSEIGKTKEGRAYTMMQDPKINVSVFNSLTLPGLKKEYIVIDANEDHYYLCGYSLEELNGHADLLSPIDKFLDYTLQSNSSIELVNQSKNVIYLDYNTYHYRCDEGWSSNCDMNNPKF